MNQDKVELFLATNSDNFPSKERSRIEEKLKQLDDATVLSAKLKNPVVALIMEITLGTVGAGAFYAKQTSFGICQTRCFLMIYASMFLFGDTEYALVIYVPWVVMFVLWIIGIVQCSKWVQQYNLNKIMTLK